MSRGAVFELNELGFLKVRFPLTYLPFGCELYYIPLGGPVLKQLTKQKCAHHVREKQEGKDLIL